MKNISLIFAVLLLSLVFVFMSSVNSLATISLYSTGREKSDNPEDKGTGYYNLTYTLGNSFRGSHYSIGGIDYYYFGDTIFSCFWVDQTYACN